MIVATNWLNIWGNINFMLNYYTSFKWMLYVTEFFFIWIMKVRDEHYTLSLCKLYTTEGFSHNFLAQILWCFLYACAYYAKIITIFNAYYTHCICILYATEFFLSISYPRVMGAYYTHSICILYPTKFFCRNFWA